MPQKPFRLRYRHPCPCMRPERKNSRRAYKGDDSSSKKRLKCTISDLRFKTITMSQEIEIIFYPIKISGRVPKGITILEAARMLGIPVESPCGGTGKCGKDIVQVRINKTLDTVLACKTVVENDMEVTLPSQEKKDDMKIIDGFFTKDSRQYNMNPSVKKELVHYGNGLYSTQVYANDNLIANEEGDTQSRMYGIALDIGTTTLVASLVDLQNGNILENSSVLNPLVYYGHDVMSRIKYATSHKDGLFRMHRELISAINFLISFLSSEKDIKPENIYQVIAAGNTTMQHIFLNKEIRGIGEYPYTPEILDTFATTAKELAIAIAEYALVTTFPCFSAYVGGDIVSGLLAIHHETLELPALFLDIGTNGEMVLFLDNETVATSTAAGPCFEGVTISSGMRASVGAIEHVRLGEKYSSMLSAVVNRAASVEAGLWRLFQNSYGLDLSTPGDVYRVSGVILL